MNVHLTPDLERIINDELKSGHFRSPEEVMPRPLRLFGRRKASQLPEIATAALRVRCGKCSTSSRKTALRCKASRLSN
jgi:hypothetical protein